MANRPSVYVYRRLSPHERDPATGEPRASAFELRPTEDGLSVIKNDEIQPIKAFTHCLATAPNKEKFCDKYGNTERDLYNSGWRVAKIELNFYENAIGSTVNYGPMDTLGHLEIVADRQAIKNCSGRIALACTIMTEEETFAR